MPYFGRPRQLTMNDSHTEDGEPWKRGVARVYHDELKAWLLAIPGEGSYENLASLWQGQGGEVFDGAAWRPLKSSFPLPDLVAERSHGGRPRVIQVDISRRPTRRRSS